jgi:hypothetical protein
MAKQGSKYDQFGEAAKKKRSFVVRRQAVAATSSDISILSSPLFSAGVLYRQFVARWRYCT